ncbi:MAG TPA: DUF3073 domain-containing protein [Jatrophihabitans sp.]|nr:DUF3073 domain-containing protein [Jatrophihabitans sp.]
MGRGRAKAKQQKVARELKYNTHFTDLDALQRELGTSSSSSERSRSDVHADDDEYDSAEDDYADYSDWTGTER